MEERTKVTLLTPGARVTDDMAAARDFIAVTDAEVWPLEGAGQKLLAAPFINVSRAHIEIIFPGH